MLEVTLEPDDDTAALRVLSLLARRRCRVNSVAFDRGDGSQPSRMRVELEPRARGEQTVERWVRGLVSVREVARAPS